MKKLKTFKSMREFLSSHERYSTMNSWNGTSSFSRNVKLHRIDGMPHEAYNFLDPEMGAYMGVDKLIREFTEKMKGNFTIGFNGRSSGYMVLYQSQYKDSGYKSECTCCGQRSYAIILDEPKTNTDKLLHYIIGHNHWTDVTYLKQSDARMLFPDMPDEEFVLMIKKMREALPKNQTYSYGKCGRCGGNECVNFDKPLMQLVTNSLSFGSNLEDMDNDDIRWMYDVVYEFNKTVDACIQSFKDYVKSHKVEEREVMVSKTIQVAVPA